MAGFVNKHSDRIIAGCIPLMSPARVLQSAMTVPPGNRLEKLAGDRAGQYSIRINGQWRVCFYWKERHADEVEITDYH